MLHFLYVSFIQRLYRKKFLTLDVEGKHSFAVRNEIHKDKACKGGEVQLNRWF